MRTREAMRGRAACLAAVAGLAVASAAHGQIRNWINPAGGVWSNPANWNPADVPNTGGESASIGVAGTYAVTQDANFSIGGYSNTNATATLNMSGGVFLSNSGGITNSGLLVINSNSANAATYLQILSSQTLTGSGQIVLNALSPNLDTAYIYFNGGGEQLTQSPGHTIRGTGRIYVRLANSGLVDADVSGRTLELTSQLKSNTGTLRARNGATLLINSDVNNTGGTIRADGGTVAINTVSMTGGIYDAINGGLISITASPFVNGGTFSGPVAVQANSNFRITGPIVNNGVITVNPAAANANSLMQFISTQPVTGNGQIVLNALSTNLDSAYLSYNGGGEVFTNGASHTVRGTGRIYVNTTNNGTITADVSGRTLQLNSQNKTNNGFMRATSGGTLDINSVTVTQGAGGQIISSGASTIALTQGAIVAGTVNTPAPGVLFCSGTSTLNSVSFLGSAVVAEGSNLRTNTGFTNNGTITVNPNAVNATTLIQIVSNCTVDGAGTIALNANAANLDSAYLIYNGGGEVMTNAAGHTIRGTGRVYVSVTNNGVIRADVNGRTLELNATSKTNNASIIATNGGNLSVASIGLTQNGVGSISTQGAGTLTFTNSNVAGGAINTTVAAPAFVLNTTFNGVTFAGQVNVVNGNSLRTNSGFTNNGTITVNPTAAVPNTFVQFFASAPITGTGAIVLNADPSNLDSAYLTYNGGGEVFTNTAAHTVRGTGRVYVNVLNNGTISADASGKTLELLGQPKTNNTLIRAIGGGRLSFSSIGMSQASTARIVAEGGSSWNFVNSSVAGGRIEVLAGGAGTYSGTNTIDSVTLSGPQSVAPNSNLRVTSAGFVNNGDLTVNTNSTGTSILQALSSFNVSGTGRIILNAPVSNPDQAYLTYNGGGEVLTNGVNHTIAGRGRVYVRLTNAGTLSPGAAPGQSANIEFRNQLTFTPTGLLDIEIGGDTEFDTITSNSPVALGNGRLRVRTYNAYTPNYNQTFDILTCSSRTGVFADIDAPGFQVEYLADRVRIRVICDGDFNQDGNVDQGDVDFLINVIAGGGSSPFLSPDFNRDGNVDQGDIDALINVIAGGACQQ